MSTGAGTTRTVPGPDHPRPSPHFVPDDRDRLLATLDKLGPRLAELRAGYWGGGYSLWQAYRKVVLSKGATLVRLKAQEEGTKKSEAQIDQESHTSDEYTGFLAEAGERLLELERLGDEGDRIKLRLQTMEQDQRYQIAQMRLA